MFQLITPKHRFVVRPTENDVILIAVRNMKDLQEEDPEAISQQLQWNAAKRVRFESYAALLAHTEELNPFRLGGYVLAWSSKEEEIGGRHRASLLSERFVSITYGSEFASIGCFNMIGEMDEKQMLEMIKGNKAQLFLSYYPEWTAYHAQLEGHYLALCKQLQQDYDSLLADSKGEMAVFCKKAKDNPHNNILISMRQAHHLSAREFVALLDPKSKLGFYRLYKKFMADNLSSLESKE